MALALDGTANGHVNGGTSLGLGSITTANAGDIVVACVMTETSNTSLFTTVSSVTATGLIFAKRNSTANASKGGGTYSNNTNLNMEIWWAYAATTLAAVAITAHLTGATLDDGAGVAFAVSGFVGRGYQANPWDQTGVSAHATNGQPTTAFTTVHPNTLIFGFVGTSTSDTYSTGNIGSSAATSLGSASETGGTNNGYARVEALAAAAPQNAIAVGFNSTGYWTLMVDALTQSKPGTSFAMAMF